MTYGVVVTVGRLVCQELRRGTGGGGGGVRPDVGGPERRESIGGVNRWRGRGLTQRLLAEVRNASLRAGGGPGTQVLLAQA